MLRENASAPQGPGGGTRGPVLRWLAVAASVVAVVALGLAAWLFVEWRAASREARASDRQVRELREELQTARVELGKIREEAVAERGRKERTRRALDVCIRALGKGVELYNTLVDELGAIGELDQAEAERYREEAERIREQAVLAIDRCDDLAN